MNPLRPALLNALRPGALALIAGALALALPGCQDTTVPVPATGTAYYPVAVGSYWTYAVADTTWSQAAVGQPSTATVSASQLRETVAATFSDAAGQPAYRLVQARRASAAAAWVDDSVFVLSATGQTVVLNRGNRRTVELIFPVRAGRSWNFNAFNNNSNDTITAETRQYGAVGQPYTTGGGPGGLPATTYPNTLTTNNTGAATEASLLRRVSYQQVFAQGVGPVLRRRVRLSFFYYNSPTNPNLVVYPPNSYTAPSGTHRETLIDYKLN